MSHGQITPCHSRHVAPSTSHEGNATVLPLDDIARLHVMRDAGALQTAHLNNPHTHNRAYQLSLQPRHRPRGDEISPFSTPAEDALTQEVEACVNKNRSEDAVHASAAIGQKPYHDLCRDGSPHASPNMCEEDDMYYFGVYNFLSPNYADHPAGTVTSRVTSPLNVDGRKPERGFSNRNTNTVDRDNISPMREKTTAVVMMPSIGTRSKPQEQSPFASRPSVLTKPSISLFTPPVSMKDVMSFPTSTQHTNGARLSSPLHVARFASHLHGCGDASTTPPLTASPEKGTDKNKGTSELQHSSTVASPRFCLLEMMMQADGCVVLANDVRRSVLHAKSSPMHGRSTDYACYGEVVSVATTTATKGSLAPANTPDVRLDDTKRPSLPPPLRPSTLSSTSEPTQEQNGTSSPQNNSERFETVKSNDVADGSAVGSTLLPLQPSLPLPQSQQQQLTFSEQKGQNISNSSNGDDTRHQRDTSCSLGLNSPTMLAPAAAPETLVSTRLGIRKFPTSAHANGSSGAVPTSPHLKNEPSMPPATQKRDAQNNPVVFSSPLTAHLADRPPCPRSISSKRSSSSRSCGSDAEFDIWEYMGPEELSSMYGDSNNDNDKNSSKYKTSCTAANEVTRRSAVVQPVPSEFATLNSLSAARRGGSTTEAAFSTTAFAHRIAINNAAAGAARKSSQARRSFPSLLAFHNNYSFDTEFHQSTGQGTTSTTNVAATSASSPWEEQTRNTQESRKEPATGSSMRNDSDLSSPSTTGDLQSDGSYVNFFNNFVRFQNPSVAGKSASVSAAGAATASTTETHEDNSKDNTQAKKNSNANTAAIKANDTPLVVSTKSKGRASSHFTLIDKKRPVQCKYLDSFFVFTDHTTPPELDKEDDWERAVEGTDNNGHVFLSTVRPPFSSLFCAPRAATDDAQSRRNEKTCASSVAATAAAGTERKSSNVQSTMSPRLSTLRHPPQPPPITDNKSGGEGSGEVSIMGGRYGYSSQLRLPPSAGQFSSQHGEENNDNSDNPGAKGDAAADDEEEAAEVVTQTTPASGLGGRKSPDSSPVSNSKRFMNPTATMFNPLGYQSPPRSIPAPQYGSHGWLRGGSDVKKDDYETRTTLETKTTSQARSGDKRRTDEITKMDVNSHSDDESTHSDSNGHGVYVYSSNSSGISSDDDDDVLTVEDEEEGDDEEDSGGSADHEGEQRKWRQLRKQEDALTQCIKATIPNLSPPWRCCSHAAQQSPAMHSLTQPHAVWGAAHTPVALHDSLKDDNYIELSNPHKLFTPHRNTIGGPSALNGRSRFAPVYSLMQMNKAHWLSHSQLHFMPQQLPDSGINLNNNTVSPSKEALNGQRWTNGVAVSQPMRDLRPLQPSVDQHASCESSPATSLTTFPFSLSTVPQHSVPVPFPGESNLAPLTETHPHKRTARELFNEARPIHHAKGWGPKPPPSSTHPHAFAELEEARRHIGAKWFKFVALEIQWVASPGLSPDDRSFEETAGAEGFSSEHEAE